MATLDVVISKEANEACFRSSPAYAHRHQQVKAVKLANGAPCESHAGPFAPWPGPESSVRCWFELANGHAVGIQTLSENEVRVLLWETNTDPR